MPEYIYPSADELTTTEQEFLPRLTQNSPIFNLFPFEGREGYFLRWEQMDNFLGLQQIRGLNGKPPRVARVGVKEYLMKPGVYGEYTEVDEAEMTLRRRMGTFNQKIDITDLVMECQTQLLQRRVSRQEWLGWELVVNGHFNVLAPNGTISHTDGYTQSTFTATVPWSTAATATPLADLRSVQLLSRGQSVGFDQGATAYMNRTVANELLSNTNAADFGGRRTTGLSPINTISGYNAFLTGEGLPNIAIYDEGYIDDSGNFQLFIPNDVVIVIGRRLNGAPLGRFRYVTNINNESGAPAPYTRVIDNIDRDVPRKIEVHDGFNGGLVLFYPGAIVKMNV